VISCVKGHAGGRDARRLVAPIALKRAAFQAVLVALFNAYGERSQGRLGQDWAREARLDFAVR
jgi:hypothetical protein